MTSCQVLLDVRRPGSFHSPTSILRSHCMRPASGGSQAAFEAATPARCTGCGFLAISEDCDRDRRLSTMNRASAYSLMTVNSRSAIKTSSLFLLSILSNSLYAILTTSYIHPDTWAALPTTAHCPATAYCHHGARDFPPDCINGTCVGDQESLHFSCSSNQ